jgi:hypothetical protein
LTKDQYPFALLTGLVFVVTVNLVLCLCAAVHSSHQKLTNLIWSLIALEESFAMDLKTNSLNIERDERENYSNSNTSDLSMMNIDFDYYLYCSITPHSLTLWRRLVANHDILIENSIAKLYGFFNIDYNGIIRFNFWWISIILIALTYK